MFFSPLQVFSFEALIELNNQLYLYGNVAMMRIGNGKPKVVGKVNDCKERITSLFSSLHFRLQLRQIQLQ